jgi:hypothetical protein
MEKVACLMGTFRTHFLRGAFVGRPKVLVGIHHGTFDRGGHLFCHVLSQNSVLSC